MGSSSSKKQETIPPLLTWEWREINWSDKQSDLQYVKSYKPPNNCQHIRILLHGKFGHGKSSLINSVCSALKGRLCNVALVKTGLDTCTNKYETYSIDKDENSKYPFVINDMTGMKNPTNQNKFTYLKDLILAMKGHMKEGYTFHPYVKLSKGDPYYNENPTDSDKVNVLVTVLDANKEELLSREDIYIFEHIREEALDLGIVHMIILTKIDEACPDMVKVKDAYKSTILKRKTAYTSQVFGVPEYSIFPVKNYHNEQETNDDIDVLILKALKRIIETADDQLNKK